MEENPYQAPKQPPIAADAEKERGFLSLPTALEWVVIALIVAFAAILFLMPDLD